MRATVWLGVVLMLGCGGGDEVDCKMVTDAGAPPAGATVVSLSAAQRTQLCDLTACQNGGYGNQHSCPSGPSVTFAGSRDQCLGQFPTSQDCRATVKDLMTCMAAVRDSPCASTFFGSACEAVTDFDCLTFTPHEKTMAAVAISR